MLKNFINAERIQITNHCDTWQEAVQLAAKPLVDGKQIQPQYVDEVIKNITNNGPYIVLKEGFALPHAQANGYVNETAMALLVLKKAVSFSDSSEHDVKVLMFLASTDPQAHMSAMVELVDRLDNDTWLNTLIAANDGNELLELL